MSSSALLQLYHRRHRRQSAPSGLVVHALHKSASMFLYRLFGDLALLSGREYYSIHESNPRLHRIPPDCDRPFVCCPERHFVRDLPNFPAHLAVRHLFQIRDPRDILVSQYFSLGWIHSDAHWNETAKARRRRIRQLSVDEYVLNEAEISESSLWSRYRPVLEAVGRSDCMIVRYEDMVADLDQWIRPIIAQFRFRFPFLVRRRLVRKYRPEFRAKPETMEHCRRIIPGDHREKLQPETVGVLNRRFAVLLETFGYGMQVPGGSSDCTRAA